MKIRMIDQDLKAQGKQTFNGLPDGQNQGTGPESADKALLDEFSRLMDKISSKVSADKPQFSVSDALISQAAEYRVKDIELKRAKIEAKKPNAEDTKSENLAVTKLVKVDAVKTEKKADKAEIKTVEAKEVKVEETPETFKVDPQPTEHEVAKSEDLKDIELKQDEIQLEIKQEVESEVDSKDMAAEVNLAVESQVTAPAEVKAQEISQAAAQVDKKVEQEVKPEVQAEEAVEKTPQVAEAKDSSKHQTKSQDKQIASEEVKSVNESPVDKEILKKATEEFKQSKPEAPAQKAPEAAQVSKELDPIQAAAEKVIRELAAQQLANTTSANAVSQALTVHTNKALGTAMMAKQGLEHSVIGQQSQQATLNSTALNPTQSVVSMTDRGAKLETAQRLVKQQALPRAQEQRTMEKVKEVLKEAAKSRDGKTLSLRLDPPSLGSVKIDVTFKDGALHARIAAESPHVNQLLRERSAELQMLLRRIGLNASTVSVSVQGDDQGFGGETMAGSQDSSNNNGSGMGDDNLQDAHVMDGSSPSLANESVLDHWVA